MENEEKSIDEIVTEFVKKSQDKYKKLIDRIKDDRDFLSGEQFTEEDDRILGKKRARSKLDVISNVIRAVQNQYLAFPYKVKSSDTDIQALYDKLSKNYVDAIETGLKNSISYGLGYICCLPNEKNGVVIPDTYAINDPTTVLYDPDSIEMDSTDARMCLIYEKKSKTWLKNNYGIDVLDSDDKKCYGIENVALEKDELLLVTFFKLENGMCEIIKLCNGYVLESFNLVIEHLPVIPIYGESIYIDDEYSWQGIVRQARPVQRLVNYTFTQLLERLAKSPKNIWRTTKEAVGNNEEYYKNSDKNINQLLLYEKYDKKGQLNEAPERISQDVQYNDLTDIMGNALNLTQSIIGVQSIGIPDERSEITATEALLNAKSYTNNIRHYFQHLKYAFGRLVKLIMNYVGVEGQYEIENGPEDAMDRQTARAELTTLVQMLQDPGDRKRAVLAIANTMNDNAYVLPFMQALNTPDPMVVQLQQQLQMTQQTMNNEIAKRELQIEQMKTLLAATKERNEISLEKAKLDNDTKILIEQMKQQELDGREAMKQQEENYRQSKEIQADFEKDKLNALNRAGGIGNV